MNVVSHFAHKVICALKLNCCTDLSWIQQCTKTCNECSILFLTQRQDECSTYIGAPIEVEMKNVPKQRMNIESLFPHKGNIRSQLTSVYWFKFNWAMIKSIEPMFLSHFLDKSDMCTQHTLVHWFKFNWTIVKNIMNVVSHFAPKSNMRTQHTLVHRLRFKKAQKHRMNVVAQFPLKGNSVLKIHWCTNLRSNEKCSKIQNQCNITLFTQG